MYEKAGGKQLQSQCIGEHCIVISFMVYRLDLTEKSLWWHSSIIVTLDMINTRIV